MHVKKNFSENVSNTVMNVPDKTKDNVKVRLDMEELCARDEFYIRTRKKGVIRTSRKRSTHYPWNKDGHCVNGSVS